MKALLLDSPGPRPRLAMRELPIPQPAADQALVKVEACGFCYHDLLVMRGVLRRGVKKGLVLGHEISGTIVDIGPEVGDGEKDALKIGDRVASLQTNACGRCVRCVVGLEHRCIHGQGIGHAIDGGFAEYVCLRAASLVRLPSQMDLEAACLLGCPMGVVQRAITRVAQVRPGERVLVTGAGGGLGAHAVQLAKAAGAQVYAVTRNEAKVEALSDLGADEVVCSSDIDYSEIVMALTEDSGVDVALDTVGSPTFDPTFRCLTQYGRLALLGEVTGQRASVSLAEVIFRDASIMGSSGAGREDLQSALELVEQGKARPVIGGRFSLEQWQDAYRTMSEGAHVGRLLLSIGGE